MWGFRKGRWDEKVLSRKFFCGGFGEEQEGRGGEGYLIRAILSFILFPPFVSLEVWVSLMYWKEKDTVIFGVVYGLVGFLVVFLIMMDDFLVDDKVGV